MAAKSIGLQVLPAGAGYGIVIGIGGVFALLMLCVTWLQNRYTRFSTRQSEEFNTASRSVKPGLIAAGIVSSWTWSATLLTSSTFAYTYGVCGPFWYGTMGSGEILVFALIAVKIKASAPGAHTFLAAYVVAGGLRSTFIADYVHTVILFIAIFVFGFLVYATSDKVGSISDFYDLLQQASKTMPISRNTDGSYLTFRSVDGLIFAMDLLFAGICTVWLDQAYWQRAIASRPETSVRAYILGGMAWYGIPFGFATAMGLGCAALTGNPSFPTYPNPLSAAQNAAGLSSPATAITLAGKGGAVLMLILLFMAVTSSTSAELIAVSSLLTFDVYKTYLKPDASSTRLVQISHFGIVLYAVVLAAFCCVLNAAGLNLTWLLTVLAIIIGGGAVPIGLVLMWERMSTAATLGAPWIGMLCGLLVWFITAWKRSGAITIDTTGDTTNAVAGNATSVGVGLIMAILLSYAFPAKYTSTDARHIERSNKIHGIPAYAAAPSTPPEASSESSGAEHEKYESEKQKQTVAAAEPPSLVPTGNELVDYLEAKLMEPMDPVEVKKATRLATGFNILFISVSGILVPFTLFGTGYIYGRSFFTGWVVVSFIWVWASMIICVIYPVVESTGALREISAGLWKDVLSLCGVKKAKAGESSPGTA
ncbi:solute symporter family transporter [Teratosphaeria destructans]|uniref:Solute symporter family transporter n=1 Tax=Teratosphaeria destructans TaxID=418781 RepID=A0A9W7W4K9_9PEZI|nr:solute symporter family transporter [Teratosphaeria destructans]